MRTMWPTEATTKWKMAFACVCIRVTPTCTCKQAPKPNGNIAPTGTGDLITPKSANAAIMPRKICSCQDILKCLSRKARALHSALALHPLSQNRLMFSAKTRWTISTTATAFTTALLMPHTNSVSIKTMSRTFWLVTPGSSHVPATHLYLCRA